MERPVDALAEQAQLDRAIAQIDPLLAESLQREQRRRWRLLALFLGGTAMLTTAVLAAVLVMSGAEPGVGASQADPAAKQQALERQQSGWALWQERRFAEAERAFAEAVKLDPSLANAWNGLGWSRFNAGQTEPAIEAFKQAVELQPDHPAALNGLGQAYQAMGDLDESEKWLLLAAPNAPAAHWGLARLYLIREQFDRALPWTILINRGEGADASARRLLKAAVERKLPDDLRRDITPVTAPADKTTPKRD